MTQLFEPSISLTNKEKALLNIEQRSFQDYFNTVADFAVPDPTYWSSTIVGNADIKVYNDVPNNRAYMYASTGNNPAQDAIGHTENKYTALRGGFSTLHLKTIFEIDDLTSEFFIGLARQEVAANLSDAGNIHVAGFHGDNDVIESITDDGAVLENNDVSAHFSDATEIEIEIILTESDVFFYLDSVLRETHSTRVPSRTQCIILASKRTNAVNAIARMYGVQVWAE